MQGYNQILHGSCGAHEANSDALRDSVRNPHTSTLFESWRIDLAESNIQVTRIHPGYVETPLTAKNRYTMPWMVTSEKAAEIIATGLAKGKKDIVFPWQMRWLMRLVWILPIWLYDRVVGYAR